MEFWAQRTVSPLYGREGWTVVDDCYVEHVREGWPGEVDGLCVSLAGAQTKLAQIDQRPPQPTPVTLGPTRTKAQQQ